MPSCRIGFDAIRALRNTTGLGNYARGVLRGLHQHDPQLDIHLYAPDPGRAEFGNLPAELGATVHLPLGTVNPISRALWRTFRLGRAVANDRMDLYHGLTHEIPRDLPRTGVRSVVTVHDLIFEKHPEYFRRLDRASYRWRYRWSATHANAIVAVSAATRADLIDGYGIDPARIAVIPPARHPAFAIPAPATERAAVRTKYGVPAEFLLSVGTLEARKNQRVLIAALAGLGAGGAPPLVLVGRDGGTLAALHREIAERGLAGRVHVLTDVATADLPALVQGATIFLYPSLVEGFGMPIVEAVSAGIPVIASGGGCFVEAGGPASRYVARNDPDGWAGAIDQLLGDGTARARMRDAGRTWATQFDRDRLAARMVAVYDAVRAGDSPAAPHQRAEAGVERAP